MGARKLAVNVIVPAPASEGGESFRVFGPNDDVPKWAVELIGDHAWAADGDAGSGDEGYSSSTVKALQAQIDQRNQDRGEDAQIEPASNKKADLIAALEADDVADGDAGSGD